MDSDDENKFKLLIRKIVPMSRAGIQRLNKRTRLNYLKEVYKPLKCITIDTERVYNEKRLAKLLIILFGPGTYDGLGYRKGRRSLSKQLFKVVLEGNIETKWYYEFLNTRGVARYGWWINT